MANILDRKSSPGTEPEPPSLIPNERLLAIYTAMVKCRMLQLRAAALFQQGKLDADLHASAGREACAAAVGVDLHPEDTLSIAPGDWLPAFVKGLPAEILFRALAPRADGHSISIADELQKRNILENVDQPAIVLERAEALRIAKQPAIVAAFFQHAATSTNQWQKTLSAAAAKKLPILFVLHAVDGRAFNESSSRSRSKTPQSLLHGLPVIAVDAADAVALYRVAYEAITRARQGRGATVLQCAPIRVNTSADQATNQNLQPPDPVAIMEAFLKSKKTEPEHYSRQVVAEFTHDLDLATRFLTP